MPFQNKVQWLYNYLELALFSKNSLDRKRSSCMRFYNKHKNSKINNHYYIKESVSFQNAESITYVTESFCYCYKLYQHFIQQQFPSIILCACCVARKLPEQSRWHNYLNWLQAKQKLQSTFEINNRYNTCNWNWLCFSVEKNFEFMYVTAH